MSPTHKDRPEVDVVGRGVNKAGEEFEIFECPNGHRGRRYFTPKQNKWRYEYPAHGVYGYRNGNGSLFYKSGHARYESSTGQVRYYLNHKRADQKIIHCVHGCNFQRDARGYKEHVCDMVQHKDIVFVLDYPETVTYAKIPNPFDLANVSGALDEVRGAADATPTSTPISTPPRRIRPIRYRPNAPTVFVANDIAPIGTDDSASSEAASPVSPKNDEPQQSHEEHSGEGQTAEFTIADSVPVSPKKDEPQQSDEEQSGEGQSGEGQSDEEQSDKGQSDEEQSDELQTAEVTTADSVPVSPKNVEPQQSDEEQTAEVTGAKSVPAPDSADTVLDKIESIASTPRRRGWFYTIDRSEYTDKFMLPITAACEASVHGQAALSDAEMEAEDTACLADERAVEHGQTASEPDLSPTSPGGSDPVLGNSIEATPLPIVQLSATVEGDVLTVAFSAVLPCTSAPPAPTHSTVSGAPQSPKATPSS